MAKPRLQVVGASGQDRSLAEASELSGQFEFVDFLVDSQSSSKGGSSLPVLVGAVASMADHVPLASQPMCRPEQR